MRRVTLVLACLSCVRCGRRTQALRSRTESEKVVVADDTLNFLKSMILAIQPASAVQLSRLGRRSLSDVVMPRRERPGHKSHVMSATLLEKDAWLADVASVAHPIAPLLAPLRESASRELEKLRFPTRREEPWRQFDLSKLKGTRILAPAPGNDDLLSNLLAEHSDDTSSGMRLVLVDGKYNAELSDLSALPSDVFVGSLLDASGDVLADLLEKLQRSLPEANADSRTALGCHTFAALNHASLSDVVGVSVPPGVNVEKPVHIVSLSTQAVEEIDVDDALPGSHPNLIVSIGEGASLELLQHYAGRGSYFVNALSRFEVGASASLKHYYVQEHSSTAFHIDSVIVDVAGDAVYENQLLQTGGRNSRVNLQVNLNQDYASAALKGLTIANDRQVIDAHTSVLHAAGNCTSEQEHRNAVGDRARAVFKGTIVVPRGSDKTVANQLARTLLLTDDARADVSPCLLIDTDEVECSHGASISDMDDEMVLYLQARGLSPIEARTLLLKGWADSALDGVPAALTKKHVEAKAVALSIPKTLRAKDLSSI